MQEEVIKDAPTENHVELTNDQKMQAKFWDDGQPAPKPIAEEKKEPVVETKVDDKVVDHKEWLKNEFNWESPDVAKAEITELRKLKDAPPVVQEIKFADDQSKLIHELIRDGKRKEVKEFLDTQDKLETYASANVDKDNAEAIIKLGMSVKNKNLTPQEIDFQYKQEYTALKEPVQKATEDDDDFKERMDEWKEKYSTVEMKRVIAAKMLQPELEKLKSQIVLPEVSKKDTQESGKKPSPEELEAFDKTKSSFLQTSEAIVKGFTGFSASVKDKDVDIQVGYVPSQEEKNLVSGKLKEFAESGFNANALLAERWVNDDGSLKVDQMVKDLSRIYMDDSVSQKLVNDAAAQRLELYLKGKKNINLNDTKQPGDFVPNNKTSHEQLQEKFWSN